MKPYFDHGGFTIFHADSREVVDQINADMVLTDPPYGVGETYTFGVDDVDFVENVAVPVIKKCIERFPRVVLTSGKHNMWKYPEPWTIMAFHFPAGAGRERWMTFNCWQPILCYGKGPRRIGSIANVFTSNEIAEKNGHPCPKPINMWRDLMAVVSNDDEVIFDPFMGSGTTLVAAKALGKRKAIGVEVEEKFCEIAAKRLSQEQLPFEEFKYHGEKKQGTLF